MGALTVFGVGSELRLRAARRVVVCAGHTYEAIVDHQSLVDRIRQISPDVLLYDWVDGETAHLDVLDAVARAGTKTRIVLLADPSPPADLLSLLAQSWFAQVLAIQSPWFMDELGATLAKLAGGSLFGLERCLPADAKIHEITISSSDDKGPVLTRIETFMDTLGVRSRVLGRLKTIADELFTNAVYDAPMGPDGPRYRHWARTRRVDLSPSERPTLRFGSDGRFFGISATDPFGNLGPVELRHYLSKGLRRGDDQIDQKEGGAGLGLFFLYDAANSFCVNQAVGKRSEIIILLDIRGSYRDVLSCPKSYSVFEEEGS